MGIGTVPPAIGTSRPIPRLPGDKDVWVFIVAELLMFGVFFGVFFAIYIVNRFCDVETFNASQLSLNRNFGVANTFFLVTSSWAVALSVRAARRSRQSEVSRYLGVAIALSFAFMLVKYLEYSTKFEAGITMTTNTFYMFYFCLTMIHLLHVIGGTIILIVMWTNAKHGVYHARNTKGLETGASYWHMVDLLWIFLFALLYLLR